MSETTRNLWVSTLHKCGAIHESMSKLTKHHFESSEQHYEFGQSQPKIDTKDVQVLTNSSTNLIRSTFKTRGFKIYLQAYMLITMMELIAIK